MDADVLEHVAELLQSPDHKLRSLACTLLLVIACPLADASLGVKPCPRLVSSLAKPYEYHDVNNTVAYARGRIAKSRPMQVALDAKLLAWLPKLPQSPVWMWTWMRRILAELADDQIRLAAVFRVRAHEEYVSRLVTVFDPLCSCLKQRRRFRNYHERERGVEVDGHFP